MTSSEYAHLRCIPQASTSPAVLEALTNAVSTEVRLIEDLIGIMRQQREAVMQDDLQGVDDSVFAVHRVLVTLGEARRQRRALNRLVGGGQDVALRELEEVLGNRMTDGLRFARDGLRAAALTLSQEVDMNRQVLRKALDAGSDYVHALYGASEMSGGYVPASQPRAGEASGGMLLNRRA